MNCDNVDEISDLLDRGMGFFAPRSLVYVSEFAFYPQQHDHFKAAPISGTGVLFPSAMYLIFMGFDGQTREFLCL